MNSSTKIANLKTTLVAAAVASILAACASTPTRPAGAAEARARLTQLQSDPALATRAPLAIQAADSAVSLAEQPESDQQLIAYRIYIADRKVDTARAEAETRLAEDQRAALSAQRERARLDARTREVDVARNQAAVARADAADQRLAADTAQSETNAANLAAANSNQQAADARYQADSANLAAANSSQQTLDAQSQTNSANQAAANSNQRAIDAQSQTNSANQAAANSNQQAIDAQSRADSANLAATNSNQQALNAQGQTNSANLAAATSNQQMLDAQSQADSANLAAANSNQQAMNARSQTDSANLAAAGSRQQADVLQQRIDSLQARATDRGLVVTLGSVLFSTGGSTLNDGGSGNLNRLVVFLNQYPERTASIEGYTDSTGNAESNQALSRRRADAVMSFLIGQGIRSDRLTASGRGESSPVASNDSASGRQQNRRVEVIINNPTVAQR
jgi:outer membrane protein OmpA-like peptidoglycan-associated protein